MAKRPVFISIKNRPYVLMQMIDFPYFNGFAISQKQKSINSLHSVFRLQNPDKKILEISSKSTEEIGVKLSAFNLKFKKGENEYFVESLFQGSKVFEKGGPYTDIYDLPGYEGKRDVRLKESGQIVGFSLFGDSFSNEPKTFFYNWLYINALMSNPELVSELVKYDAFTDIEFNPQKSLNCQAEAVAIFVALYRAGCLTEALKSKEGFLSIVYGVESTSSNDDTYEQMSIMDLM